MLKHGTGALNIDGSRIPHDEKSAAWVQKWAGHEGHPGSNLYGDAIGTQFGGSSAGRWPANVILDESQAAALDEQAGAVGSNSGTPTRSDGTRNADGLFSPGAAGTNQRWETRGAGASRFFKVVAPNPPFMYTAKAGSAERPKVMREDGTEGRVLGKGLERVRQCNICGSKTIKPPATEPACGHNDWQYVAVEKRDDHVSHPTVKPLDLMRWLVRLVTPKGGTVLEPFAGSGTTVEAAVLEGFRCIAIEREADYVPLIMQRVSKPHAVGLDFGDWEDAS